LLLFTQKHIFPNKTDPYYITIDSIFHYNIIVVWSNILVLRITHEFFIEHVGKATMKNYKYFVKKISIDEIFNRRGQDINYNWYNN